MNIVANILQFIYTWLFNRTKGSVLLSILAHTSVDAFDPSEFLLAPVVRGASNIPFLVAFRARGIVAHDFYAWPAWLST